MGKTKKKEDFGGFDNNMTFESEKTGVFYWMSAFYWYYGILRLSCGFSGRQRH